MRHTDRRVGAALALLGLAVAWSARAFPDVPGQKLGAAFLPMLVGIGLAACGLGLVVRSWRGAYADDGGAARPAERFGAALVFVAAVAAYIGLAERLGFLLVAPVLLAVLFATMRVKPAHALLWAVVGTVVVHATFYKLLRVPLPWGVLRPFY